MIPPELLGGEHEHGPRMPEKYGLTARFCLLRACERMGGGRPAEFIASLTAYEEAELLAYERIRSDQESRVVAATLAAAGAVKL